MDIGGIKVSYLGHSGFLIHNGKRIAIDPYNISDVAASEKVDLILITHSHYDHCSIKDIQKLAKKGTVVVVPADGQSKITRVENIEMQIIEVGDELTFGDVKVSSVPAYNVDKEFHPKSEGWMGYIIKMGNVVIYHSGDSDKIPEMSKLSGYGKEGNKFVAMLPVSGTYCMTAEEAAEVASIISPSVAIPMHYGSGVAGTLEDAQRFVKLCMQSGLKAEVLEKI